MQKLYLVRRNLEVLVGPLSFAEVKRGFERMEFGLQDEIAGHCSRWVFLENNRLLRRYYPEIYAFVYESTSRWHENSSRAFPSHRPSKFGARASYLRYVVGGCLLVGMAWLLWTQRQTLAQRLPWLGLPNTKEVKVVEAQALYRAERKDDLEVFLRNNRAAIVGRSDDGIADAWLPYMRWLAFRSDGAVDGLAARVLRGPIAEAVAPAECSIDSWKARFLESLPDWRSLFGGRQLPRAHWVRLLAWDPHWVVRRPQSGWLAPESYYGACVAMAAAAFKQVVDEPDFERAANAALKEKGPAMIAGIQARLAWLTQAINERSHQGTPRPSRPTSALETWTCLEMSTQWSELSQCYTLVAEPNDDEWAIHHNNRYIYNFIRLLVGKEPVAAGMLQLLEDFKARVEPIERFTRLDYRAEVQLLKIAAREQGDIRKSLERARLDFPSVDLTRRVSEP